MARKNKVQRALAVCLGLSLLDFIPAVSPLLMPPTHLADFAVELEGAYNGRKRVVVDVPCQHGKSTLVHHAVPWLLQQHPRATIVYATYSKTFALRGSRSIRRLAEAAGIDLSDDHNTMSEWKTSEDGGLVATSVDGEATGYKADVIFVDDPYKNRKEAENPAYREEVESWLTSVILPRLTPNGSVFIVMSRWHEDDLSGSCIRKGWKRVHLPAINDNGEALCPWGPDPENPRDIDFLLRLKAEIGDYDFESLYQGNPMPPGGNMFKDPTHADGNDKLHPHATGMDLAYTDGSQSDGSACIVATCTGPGKMHILDVIEWKASFAEAGDRLHDIQNNTEGAPFVGYYYGPERGALEGLVAPKDESKAVTIVMLKAPNVSKFIRALDTSKAWNRGDITIDTTKPWAKGFIKTLKNFTGSGKDSYDDPVDGLVAVYDFLCGGASQEQADEGPIFPRRCA